MHIPKHFQIKDQNEILSFIEENPLGILITAEPQLQACHLPFIITQNEQEIILEAHLARANQQSYLTHGTDTLVVFNGANGYISSSVYEKVNAPTYNYSAVHLSGKLSILSDKELVEHLHSLVNKHENGRSIRFSMEQMPPEMLTDYLNEIIGIRIHVGKVEAAYKLSQNRNEKDFKAIVDDLANDPSNAALIKAMKKTR